MYWHSESQEGELFKYMYFFFAALYKSVVLFPILSAYTLFQDYSWRL